MKEIKVSVIMPVYNAKSYLEETLNYVLNQTLKDIELICIDDGSTDGSSEILKGYEAKDERMTVLRQQNQYAGVARNNGLAIAKGKYVIFWDADDIFRTDALEKLYLKAEEDVAEITVCAANKYDEINDEIVLTNTYLVKDRLPEQIPFSKDAIGKYIFNFAGNVPWNKLYLKEFVEKHGLQFEARRQANDTYFVMMAFSYAEKISAIDETLIDYRVRTGASITDRTSKEPLCAMESFDAVLQELKKQKMFFGDLRKSFINKAMTGFMHVLTIQSTFEAYQMVYNYLKNEGISYFEIDQLEESDFYNLNIYENYKRIMQVPAEEFLVYMFKNLSEEMKTKNSRIRSLRERRDELKEQREQLKLRRDELKEERTQLKSELSDAKKVIKQQQKILDSRTVRYALKAKDVLTFNKKGQDGK